MNQWIQLHLERVKAKKAESTHETHRGNLRDFNRWLTREDRELTVISPLELEDYFLGLMEQDYAPNTIASRYDSVLALFNRLEGRFGAIEDNPFDDLERKEFVKQDTKKHSKTDVVYITKEEKEALCENVPAPKIRNELIIRMLWQTGIRKCELAEIELEDLEREEREIPIWSNKSNEWRTVFYCPSLDLLLDQWLDGGYRDSFMPAASSPYLFLTNRSEQLNKKTVGENIVKPAAEAAGIQEVMYEDQCGAKRHRITPHALRHGHAINALKSDIDVRRVQQHLGHSSLDITMDYLQFVDEDVKEAYERFEA